MDYSRRAYRLRDESRDFDSAKVEVAIIIDGNTTSRMVVPPKGMLSIVRTPEGVNIDVVSEGGRISDTPAEDPKLARPESWQLEALKSGR